MKTAILKVGYNYLQLPLEAVQYIKNARIVSRDYEEDGYVYTYDESKDKDLELFIVEESKINEPVVDKSMTLVEAPLEEPL